MIKERELLAKIFLANRSLPERVTIKPGDDLAAVRWQGETVLIGVDQIADGVHFELAETPLEKVCRKAVTRNLSDVAAMAASPVGTVAAACLPRGFGRSRSDELVDHLREVAAAYDCPLIGGDVAVWDQGLLLTVTILAETSGIEPLTRTGAQVGDAVCVTGRLGGSMIEFEGQTHHLDFEPRIAIARQLAANGDTRPHCMIDLSDGLGVDVGHLCRASGVSAELWVDRLPVSDAAREMSRRDKVEPWRHALGDGEDYELCFTVSARQMQRALPSQIDDTPITQVGRITPADTVAPVKIKMPDGSLETVGDAGWEHRGCETGG